METPEERYDRMTQGIDFDPADPSNDAFYVGGYYIGYRRTDWHPSWDTSPSLPQYRAAWEMGQEDGKGDRQLAEEEELCYTVERYATDDEMKEGLPLGYHIVDWGTGTHGLYMNGFTNPKTGSSLAATGDKNALEALVRKFS